MLRWMGLGSEPCLEVSVELTSCPARWLDIPLSSNKSERDSEPGRAFRAYPLAPLQPISGSNFFQYLKAGSYSPTLLLQDIMLATFPAQVAERWELHQAEMAELSK